MVRLLPFRRVKHATPARMKVLAEDVRRGSWLDRLSPSQFVMLVSGGALATAIVGSSVASPEFTRIILPQGKWFAATIADNWSENASRDKAKPIAKKPQSIKRPKVMEVARSRSSGCHPNYAGCLPIGVDVDCVGGHGNGPAFTGRVQVIGSDVYGLDRDGDGIGCE